MRRRAGRLQLWLASEGAPTPLVQVVDRLVDHVLDPAITKIWGF
jgi:hypothetical protein